MLYLYKLRPYRLLACLLASAISFTGYSQSKLGVFESNTDVGFVLHKGSTVYDVAKQQYVLTGSGSNIWFKKDEFQYAWKKMKGNFILQTRAVLEGKGVDAHRKIGWMVRNSLDTGSAMACATVHGDGLTSLQYRKKDGDNVEEARSALVGADVIQLERKGNKFIMSVASFGQPFTITEVADLNLNDEVYAGIFVCSHNKDVVEKAVYSNVRVIIPAKEDFIPYRDYIGSHIEVMDVQTGLRKIIYSEPRSLQAPNFTLDGKSLLYNSQGLMYRLDLKGKKPSVINTDFVKQNNNDHVISFDGKMLGLSSSSGEQQYGSLVYTVPIKGGKPKRITAVGPSYLHGFSPDGKWLTFTGGRNNEYDIYKISVNGGEEIKLTTNIGLDDGSEYSPDGNYIYFNSTRSGLMQLWRMKPDGTEQEQVTNDEFNNWFPHISPDGKWIAFLSFLKDVKPDDHPFYKHVYLRLMPVDKSSEPKVIAYVYGGQATINTPSWSPDGKQIAFVSNTDGIKTPIVK
jgi:TolB protein